MGVSRDRSQPSSRPPARPAAAAILLALLLALGTVADASAGVRLKPLAAGSQIEGVKLYDLGVADFNDDANLDIFTTNHKFSSSLLAGDGRGGFTDVGTATGFGPTPQFPGYEDLRREPDRNAPGLYLYATDRDQPRDPFHLATTAIAASGSLTFDAQELQVESSIGVTTATTVLPDGRTRLTFDAAPDGQLDITVEHIDLPIAVAIDPPLEPGQIHVGADAVAASARELTLTLRDRHSYGFADYDGDLATDAFIATGGLGGEIVNPFFTGKQTDELLLRRTGRYLDATAASGLLKGVCRGRDTRPADLDGDGDLDLLETCDSAIPQLYLGDGTGGFTPAAGPPALGSVYRLADLGRDGVPELIAAVGAELQTWSYRDGAWTETGRVSTLNGETAPQTLAAGDLDGDGDLDLLATARGGNTVLLNIGGRLRRRTPIRLGLPQRRTFAASFVDYDNDGDLDLDLIPQGLFESVDGAFEPSGRLRYGSLPSGPIGYATVSWPDLDGDGRRDLLSARGRGEFAAEGVVDLRRNRTKRTGHWLELDLLGPPGNRQSIGAWAKVRTDAGTEYGWVGQNEDSRHSSGHYRIYFGLGDERRIRKLVAHWPDGHRARRSDFRADRLLRVSAPDR